MVFLQFFHSESSKNSTLIRILSIIQVVHITLERRKEFRLPGISYGNIEWMGLKFSWPYCIIGITGTWKFNIGFSSSSRSTIPICFNKLRPRAKDNVKEELEKTRGKQKMYGDECSNDMEKISVGDEIRYQPRNREWIG